jgi:hypothetical protein
MRKRRETPDERAARRRRDERWAAEQLEFRELAARYEQRVRLNRERTERRRRLLDGLFQLRRAS